MPISDVKIAGEIKGLLTDEYDHSNLINFVDDDLTTYVINGHTVVKDNRTGEFIDYVLMSDQYFYSNWVAQFAIGVVGGKNYFNITAWSDITEQLTKGVMIVNEETKKLLFIIPKFIDPVYSPEARAVVDELLRIANNVQFQKDSREQHNTISALSQNLNDIADNDVPNLGLTGLIPPVIYELYNINPKAMKAVIYIRDHYGKINDDPTFDRLNQVLKRYFDGDPISSDEKQFVGSLCNNEFIFDDSVNGENNGEIKKEAPAEYKRGFSPFED